MEKLTSIVINVVVRQDVTLAIVTHTTVNVKDVSRPFRSTWIVSGVHVAQSLVFCVVFCRSLFVRFLLAIVLPLFLRFTTLWLPFGIFRISSKGNLKPSIFSFLCSVSYIVACIFSFSHLVLSVLLLFTTHDYRLVSSDFRQRVVLSRKSLVFWVVFCRSLLVPFLLAIVLSPFLLFTTYVYRLVSSYFCQRVILSRKSLVFCRSLFVRFLLAIVLSLFLRLIDHCLYFFF